jgi:hypothetical protein
MDAEEPWIDLTLTAAAGEAGSKTTVSTAARAVASRAEDEDRARCMRKRLSRKGKRSADRPDVPAG